MVTAITFSGALVLILGWMLTVSLRIRRGREKKPDPYQVQPGQFPPEGSSHYLAGEMIQMDHVNRTGQLRPDRRDDQRTDDYDRALLFTMLPYGTLRYHGAPAELRDIPIGTHLHGEFYWDPKAGKGRQRRVQPGLPARRRLQFSSTPAARVAG